MVSPGLKTRPHLLHRGARVLDLERLTEIASNLYGATKDSVITDLREGKINGKFYAPS